MNRRHFLQAAAALGGVSLIAPRARADAARRPNVVFILADDLGYGDLGCYGQEVIQTPRLDRMAAEGMRFTSCYAGSTVCAPSRSCLMTGQHTGHTEVRGNKLVPLRPEDVTVAEVLRGAGYGTTLIGKWGLGEPDTPGLPNRQGFDQFYGYLNQRHAHTYYPEYLWRNEEQEKLRNVESKYNVAETRLDYSHDLFAEEALKFLDAPHEDPFFLYLALTIPHTNNERGAALGDGMEVPDYGEYADRDWPDSQKGHAAMISRMDHDIGRFLDKLKAQGLEEDTIVFFTSDNGTHKEGGAQPEFFKSSGPLRGIKRDLYEGGIRVPGIVRWPGQVEAGAVNDTPWAFWDFLPTAAALAGADVPEGVDGISMVPTLLGKPGEQAARDYLYWEFHEGGFKQAMRKGHWKAVRPGTKDAIEIYDLSTDLGETMDLAAKYPEKVAEAEAIFASARTPSSDWPTPGERSERKKQ